MQKIIWSKGKTFTVQITVEDDPTPGTLGSHRLLLQEYRRLDPPKTSSFQQMLFNTQFLRDMQKLHGKLWCVYCGKKGLRIYHWQENDKVHSIMATADHFIPKSHDPNLARDVDNLRVCCHRCNTKKANHLWEEKFPYKNIDLCITNTREQE